MAAKLSTHALDLSLGQPASGLTIRLYEIDSAGQTRLRVETITNADGRTDEPLLAADQMKAGSYELVFCVQPYFLNRGVESTLWKEVPVRFQIVDPSASYHIPLLFTPWAYSVYRGS